jgi:hypothetical protein
MCPALFKYSSDSTQKNIDIKPNSGSIYICNIESEAIIKLKLGTANNLP